MGYAGIELCKSVLEEINKQVCCARCKHFCPHEPVTESDNISGFEYHGECRRFPPQVSHPCLQDDFAWSFPDVSWNYWCGEWTEHELQLEEIMSDGAVSGVVASQFGDRDFV